METVSKRHLAGTRCHLGANTSWTELEAVLLSALDFQQSTLEGGCDKSSVLGFGVVSGDFGGTTSDKLKDAISAVSSRRLLIFADSGLPLEIQAFERGSQQTTGRRRILQETRDWPSSPWICP